MTHKEEVKLRRLLEKLCAQRDIVLSLLADKGKRGDGTGKDRLVFQVDRAEFSNVKVTAADYYYKFKIHLVGTKTTYGVTDDDMSSVLGEVVKKVKEEKKQAKAKADAERQKKSKIGYMDVFTRVAAFIKKNGYTISTPTGENDKVRMNVSGNVLKWNSVKDFICAGWEKHHANFGDDGCVSIFRAVSCWTHKYWKLVYPSLKTLVDKMKVLGEVDEQAILPVAVMDELNRLKI